MSELNSADPVPLSQPQEEGMAAAPAPGNPLLSTRQRTAILAIARRSSTYPETTMLVQDAAALVAQVLGADLNSIGMVSGGGTLTLNVAETGPAGEYLPRASREFSLEPELSMAGYTVMAAGPVVSARLAQETRFTDLFLRELGAVCGLTVPLPARGFAFGTIGVYWKTLQEVDPVAVDFAETIGHMLGTSLARAKTENEHQRQQILNAMVLTAIDSIVMLLDLQGNLMSINYAGSLATGFSSKEIEGRPFTATFVIPEEQQAFQTAFSQTLQGHKPVTLAASLVTKANQRQKVVWNLRELVDRSGQAYAVLMVGNDCPSSQCGPPRPLPLIDQQKSPQTAREQRASPRLGYGFRQQIAPIYGGAIPQKKDFRYVQCHDISRGGFSFYLNEPPDYEDLVIALGSPPQLNYLAARVTRVAEEERESGTVCVVGCRFTGRLPGLPLAGRASD
jgi:PAS domain S-box-containing protein